MIYVRMYFFRAKFKHVIAQQEKNRPGFSLTRTLTSAPNALRQKFTRDPGRDEMTAGSGAHTPVTANSIATSKRKKGPINKDMIKRIDGGGVGMVNPMGWYDAVATPNPTPMTSTPGSPRPGSPDHDHVAMNGGHQGIKLQHFPRPSSDVELSSDESKKRSMDGDSGEDDLHNSPALFNSYEPEQKLSRAVTNDSVVGQGTAMAPPSTEPYRRPYAGTPAGEEKFPRSKTIAFDEPDNGFAHTLNPGQGGPNFQRNPTMNSNIPWTTTMGSGNFPRTYSLRPQNSQRVNAKYTGFGGFPTPLQLISKGFSKAFPNASTKLTETVTMPRTNTITGRRDSIHSGDGVPYISFSAVVGRNSNFKGLTEEQMDELGGVEYRALKLLFWIVLCYWIFLPLAGATIIAPYIAAGNRYHDVFDSQYKHVRIPWFAFFQAYSGFTNLGMSLVDQSVVPFQKAYLMNFGKELQFVRR